MIRTFFVSILIFLTGCATQTQAVRGSDDSTRNAEGLLVIDCLLPGQVRKLGRNLTYLTPRRPVKTNASDCEIRGGEYVAYDRANYATALKVWLPQAQQGDPAAQTYVGEIYEKGLGIEADYAIAAHWYKLAAEQDYSRAQINLGYLFEGGLGVPRDLTIAMNWYRKASGLKDGNLEYVSSVEIANREAVQRESAALKQEVSQLRGELGQTRELLRERKVKLAKAQQDAIALKKKLQERKQALAVTMPSAGPIVATVDSTVQQDLEIRLEDSQKEQQRLITKLSQQQLAAKELSRKLDEAQLQLENRKQQLESASSELEYTTNELKQVKLASANEKSLEIQRLIAKERNLQAEIDTHKQAMSKLEVEMRTQRAKLSDELSAAQRKEQELQLQLETRNQEIVSLQEQLNATNEQLVQAGEHNKELQAMAEDLKQRETEIEKQKQEIEQLQAQVSRNSKKSEDSGFGAVVVAKAVGPTIEIIDPPLSVTRSKPVINLRSVVSEVDIVGRVSPHGELLTFHVNDQTHAIAENGLFQLKVPVQQPQTPVNLVAVDNNGARTAVDFLVIPRAERTQPVINELVSQPVKKPFDVDFGNYYALIIGNNDYTHLTTLRTARNDAKAVDEILRRNYGFKTKLLLDADRYTMLSALNELRETLSEKDNLLIYYAGHGELDSANLRGYWLPVDAEPDISTNWISNVAITDILNVLPAKHVMVVADSCYSGAMTRTSLARLQGDMPGETTAKWLKIMSQTKARAVLTSGGVKPVLDSGGGDHSIFAKAFLDVLRENDSILEGFRLYVEVTKRVRKVAAKLSVDQNPQYAPIKYAGHEAGEFFFLPNDLTLDQVISSSSLNTPRMAMAREPERVTWH